MSEMNRDFLPLQCTACSEASFSCDKDVATLFIKPDYDGVNEAYLSDGPLEVFGFKVSTLPCISCNNYLRDGEGMKAAV